MKKSTTKELTFISIGAALIACLSQVSIPIHPVPFTLQTLAIGLLACLYPRKSAVLSVLTYLLLGAIGLPVFASFSGGLASLVSPTAGFLWGFLLYAFLTSTLVAKHNSPVSIFLANLAGDCACFLVGILVFHLVAKASWMDTLAWTTVPFLIPELIKISLISLSRPTLLKVFATYLD